MDYRWHAWRPITNPYRNSAENRERVGADGNEPIQNWTT
jgi:hypothetical protein